MDNTLLATALDVPLVRASVKREAELTGNVGLYLRDIGRVDLLRAEDEVRLGRQIEVGVLAAERLASRLDLSPEEHADLETLVTQGESATRQLIEANLRLVVCLAKHYAGCGVPLLDLVQEGNLGLMRAVQRFDYRRGNKFSTYASWWIRQALARAVGDQARTIRLPVHVAEALHRVKRFQRELSQELGRTPTVDELARYADTEVPKLLELLKLADEPISLDAPIGSGDDGVLGDLIVDDDSEEPLNEVAQQSMRREVEALLRRVTPREQHILQLRFGLRSGRPHTLAEVGLELGITRERVRQIEARALARIRNAQGIESCREYLPA